MLLCKSPWADAFRAVLPAHPVDRLCELPVAGRLDARGLQFELIARGHGREAGEPHSHEACRHAPGATQARQQFVRHLENHAIRNHGLTQRALCRASLEIEVAQLHGHRARGQLIAAQVRGGARHQPQQLALDVFIRVQVCDESLVAGEAAVQHAMRDRTVIHAVNTTPQPCRLALAHRALERGSGLAQYILDRDEAARRQPLLELGTHHRDLGERAGAEERLFLSWLDDHHAVAVATRLRAIDRHLGDQLVRTAANRQRETRRLLHRGANALRRCGERFVMIDAFGACQIDVPLIDARAFHDRRKLLQGLANFAALLPALLEWHGHAERVRAEAKRARDRHRRAHTELASFVGRGADDAAALARAADDEQRRFAGAVRIDGARDRDIECVSICQEYPTHSRRYAEESGYVQTDAFLAQVLSL